MEERAMAAGLANATVLITTVSDELKELAGLYGVQTRYTSASGEACVASEAALLPILKSLGADLSQGYVAAAKARLAEFASQLVEPVTVLWSSAPAIVPLLIQETEGGTISARLTCEDGSRSNWTADLRDLPIIQITSIGNVRYVRRKLTLPDRPDVGYHELEVTWAGRSWTTHVLSAPEQAWLPDGPAPAKSWGVFLPLYALRTERDWGVGDFSDLKSLVNWTQSLGGTVVATLPLLAAFLKGEPYEPSPYSPASRLFWNELFVDVESLPEFQASPAAQALVRSESFQTRLAASRKSELVDYPTVMALKREVLEILATELQSQPGTRKAELERLRASSESGLADYARFRAVCERRGASWWTWPEPLRSGTVTPADYDESAAWYHAYVQWVTDEQLRDFSTHASAAGPGLYLDLPLGVNSDSYDVWRERDAFAIDMSAGAPPDPFFPGGQCWGFPPLHPERIRTTGYRYFREVIRHHMRHAGILRLDHIMGLTRLYWIPHGISAKEGVYVQYRLAEFCAILCIESHRNRTVLVGEDLGTVPPEIPAAMQRHKIHQMYVAQFSVNPQATVTLAPAPSTAYANVNSHDMPPFAAFWNGTDVADRLDLGILTAEQGQEAEADRARMRFAMQRFLRDQVDPRLKGDDATAVLQAVLRYLAGGDAPVLLVNLEDLWGETLPQNIPGTWRERPNWRRRARLSLEQVCASTAVVAMLQAVDHEVRRTSPETVRKAS
jgi:4-alpha-glucanotransferase